ncbi:mRNA-decapping enzyme 1B-like isoform X2 [Liolophura sinensis]
MILNRLGLNNLIEPIIKDLEFQLQDPFLLYRNTKAIFGIWFYDKDECARIGQLMNCLVQLAIEHHHAKTQSSMRQRRASESDSMVERPTESMGPTDPQQVDIIQMLSKAQHEYVKSKGGTSIGRKAEPKPMIDNPNAAATKTTQLIRPMPLKLSPSQNFESETSGGAVSDSSREAAGGTPITAISLEALFRNASITKQRCAPGSMDQLGADATSKERPSTNRSISLCESSHLSEAELSNPASSSSGASLLHPILQQLMSTGPRLETVEQQQLPQHPQPGDLSPRHPPGPGGDMVSSKPQARLPFILNPELLTLAPDASVSTAQTMSFNIIKPSLGAGSGINVSAGGNKSPDIVNTLSSPATYSSPSFSLSSTGQAGQSFIPDKSSAKSLEDRIASICSVQKTTGSEAGFLDLSSSTLLTPAEFETSSVISEKHHPPLAITLPAPSFSTDVLLSPMVFTTSARGSPPVSHLSCTGQGDASLLQPGSLVSDVKPSVDPRIAPLTKEQLKQALIYLLQTDTNFVSSIHEAYLKSLQAGLSSGKL